MKEYELWHLEHTYEGYISAYKWMVWDRSAMAAWWFEEEHEAKAYVTAMQNAQERTDA